MSVKAPKGIKTAAAGTVDKVKGTISKVPGPSSNPATNILIWDIATRGVVMIVGRQIEKAMLRMRYDQDKASDIVKGRTMVKSMTATGAARVASKSIPGLLAVTGALLAKTAFDRGYSKRESRRRGEKTLSDQAANAEE
ncbi:MAG: hypothetical protein J7493_09235 [Porphyrobacter sp.]|nr:hypothetical protein [Porphyrobacter sp.]